MNMWSRLTNVANGVSQRFFGEPAIYRSADVDTNISALFEVAWVEVNGVSAQALTCQIRLADIPAKPKKGDQIVRGTTVYGVTPPQIDGDGSILTLILKEQ